MSEIGRANKSSNRQHTPDGSRSTPRNPTHGDSETSSSPRQIGMVMALQQIIGNAATIETIQRLSAAGTPAHDTIALAPALPIIQRQPAGGGAAGGADPAADALTELRTGNLLERNTAELIDSGEITYFYIDQCQPDPDSSLEADSPYQDVLHPSTGAVMRIQKNAIGFRSGNSVFIARTLSVASVKETFVHEVNHALRGDTESDEDASSFARYRDEFQAYWIDGTFITETDLDRRAERIRDHLLNDYPAIKERYDSDEAFKTQVDNHTRPDGNVINSVRWLNVQRAVEGLGTDEESLFSALRGMNADEKQVCRSSTAFMGMVEDDLSGDELAIAYLLLYDFSEHAVACIQAMSGLGTNEEAIYQNLLDMPPAERQRLQGYSWFMDRLRDDLDDDEMGVVSRIMSQ